MMHRWKLLRRVAGLALTGAAFGACNVILGNHTPGVLEPEAGTNVLCQPRACGKDACGVVDDGCGAQVDCGGCTLAGFACRNGVCECKPTNCEGRCGFQADDCEGEGIDCGACGNEELTCGGEFLDYCGKGSCVPRTCNETTAAGPVVRCDSISDGCGGRLDCGACPPGEVCGANRPTVCGSCIPSTCKQLGAECGTVQDTRCPGTTVNCLQCAPGQTCTDQHQCAGTPTCTPDLSKAAELCGTSCGNEVDLGCGPDYVCPCGAGAHCVQGTCCKPTPTAKVCEGLECGTVDDGCGTQVPCGPGCGAGGDGAPSCDPQANLCTCVSSSSSFRLTACRLPDDSFVCCNANQRCGATGCDIKQNL